MIIVFLLVSIGIYLLYQGFKEKTGCGCLALVLVAFIVLIIVGRLLVG